MKKNPLFRNLFLVLFVMSLGVSTAQERVGNWRVEIGPPGNEFYETPAEKYHTPPPSEKVLDAVKSIAPPESQVAGWEVEHVNLYSIELRHEAEVFDFLVNGDGVILELEYENNATGTEESPGDLILKDTKKEVTVGGIPAQAAETIGRISADGIGQAWTAQTPAGKRYVIQAGNNAYYAKPEGQITAIGQISGGALDEIELPQSAPEVSEEEIAAQAHTRLAPYRETFNISGNISKLLADQPADSKRIRFVVMGDSRSNPDMWQTIIKHIDDLNPAPAFVINTGDIVRHGYTQEYLDYYIPPLLNTPVPYFVAIGNHDDGDSGMATEYRTLFGEQSLNYYFDYGGFRFIFIDNVTRVQSAQQTLHWLETVLKKTPQELSVIVSAHKPPATIRKWAYHAWDEISSRRFTELLSEYRVAHVFLGHIHAYSTASLNGVDYTIAGGGGAGLHDRYGEGGNVHHYLICDVAPDGTLTQQIVRFYPISQ